jgi:hypothetical protein
MRFESDAQGDVVADIGHVLAGVELGALDPWRTALAPMRLLLE